MPENTPEIITEYSDQYWMQYALNLADKAQFIDNEIPVGAVMVNHDNIILGEGWNHNITDHDPTAHAEIVALRQAGKILENYRMLNCTLYVTLEPCAMCAMALIHARIKRVVFAASDYKTGACGGAFDFIQSPKHNHRIEVESGVLADIASLKLTNYFRAKRGQPLL